MGFDFDELRLPPTFGKGPAAKKLVTVIPCRKPKSGVEFFRIRPGPEWEFQIYILDLKEGDDEKYLVLPPFIPELLETGKLRPVTIYMAIVWGTGVFFLSDVPLPDADGNDNPFNKSRRASYEKAKTRWIKIRANLDLGAYEMSEAVSQYEEPEWPEKPETIQDAIEIAFKDRLIDSLDHPVLKRLRGEI